MNVIVVLACVAAGGSAAAALLAVTVRLRRSFRVASFAPEGGGFLPWSQLLQAGSRWRQRRAATERRRRFDRAVLDWVDLLQMAAAAGMTLQAAVSYTTPLADSPLREALVDVQRQSRAGDALAPRLHETLDAGGQQAAAQVAHLLSDSARRGLPLRSALANLKGDMLQRRRHLARRKLKTIGLKIAVGTVFFLFPPAFVVVIMPSLLAFFGW